MRPGAASMRCAADDRSDRPADLEVGRQFHEATNGSGVMTMSKLTREEVARRLQALDGWTLDGNAIKKQFTFSGFSEAVRFVNRLVPEAEAADHHPDILINYKRVTLTYSTHSEGGLTEKDFAAAETANRLV